jgi:uncharacterized protein DUF4232
MAVSKTVRAFVLGVLLAGLLVGCGGGTKTVVETTTVVRTATVHEVTTTATTTTADANGCTGDAMGGTFKVIAGSAGAGQIAYRLTLKNTSPVPCFVSGLPDVQLRSGTGTDLPTKVTPEQPGTATAARIVLNPGASATADARFSPDVNGTGDQTNGPCQPQATTLRVALGGAPLDVPISPPTSVCERGMLQFKLFSAS